MYHETNDDDREKLIHNIIFRSPGGKLDVMKTNSMHHQVVDRRPENSIVSAYYIEQDEIKRRHKNGTLGFKYLEGNHIEGLIYTNYPAASVQWHPKSLGLN